MPNPNFSRDASPGANVFLDKIAIRLDVVADSLREFADKLDGRECITADEADDLRHAVAEASTSLQVVEAISRHFAADLIASGGISAESLSERRTDRLEASIVATVQAAIAGNGPTAVNLAASTGVA